MEVEINIEESCAILSAVKLLTRLRSSIASYSYSHRLDSSCTRRLTRARDTVSQYLDRGSLLHREEIRSTDHSAAPLPPPPSLSLFLPSRSIEISPRGRERESPFSFLGGLRFRSSAGIRNSSSSSSSIRDPSDPIAANCDLFLNRDFSPSSFLPVEEEEEEDG